MISNPSEKLTYYARSMLPFSDAASPNLPLSRLFRLSLFQVSVGMATVLLLGTLNRVMIVELGISAFLVALMIALPVITAPLRALMGYRSDNYRSAIGWKRIPFIWFGSLWQFAGLAIMPMSLIVLSGNVQSGPLWLGYVWAGLAFLMTGFGMHMTQTAGLALAADRASEETRPRVVALLYVMFLVGMGVSAIIIGFLLKDFSNLRLIQVIQGTAVVTLLLNLLALWKQESLSPMTKEERQAPRPSFKKAWADFNSGGAAGQLLAVVALGTLAFSMQDVLLEPYGGEILGLSVASTTMLTASWALGALVGFFYAAIAMRRNKKPVILAAIAAGFGIVGFSGVIFADPFGLISLFYISTTFIGFGAGLFAVSTLTIAMALPLALGAGRGLALGAWGAAQATAGGLGVALGGGLRDFVNSIALDGTLGATLAHSNTGYSFVYHTEIALLFLTLLAIGPLTRLAFNKKSDDQGKLTKLGLAELPS